MMPIEKIENNKIVGISGDYVNIFRDKLGVNFKFIESNSTEDSFNKLKNFDCDIAPFVLKNKTNMNRFNFSDSYISFPLVLTTRLEEPL